MRAAPADDGSAAATRPQPVLVELFTSQGCSSCPPADALLSTLSSDRVVPLAFHVDYWNDLGWRDPFSSAQWTKRQRTYARHLGSGRVYTPQLVVQGASDAVGSQKDDVMNRIDAAARARPSTLRVTARPELRSNDSELLVEVDVEGALDSAADVMLAVYESGLDTDVGRGENSGRHLVNDFVVRRLLRVASLEPSSETPARLTEIIKLDRSWRPASLGVVAFAQRSSDLGVLAVHRAEP